MLRQCIPLSSWRGVLFLLECSSGSGIAAGMLMVSSCYIKDNRKKSVKLSWYFIHCWRCSYRCQVVKLLGFWSSFRGCLSVNCLGCRCTRRGRLPLYGVLRSRCLPCAVSGISRTRYALAIFSSFRGFHREKWGKLQKLFARLTRN